MLIYIAYCDLYPDQFKLGMTTKSIDKRMRELSCYSSEEQFKIDGYKSLCEFDGPFKDYHFHKKFKKHRIGNDRELFSIDCLSDVLSYIHALKEIDAEVQEELQEKINKEKKMSKVNDKRSEIFKKAHLFASMEEGTLPYRERFSICLTTSWGFNHV